MNLNPCKSVLIRAVFLNSSSYCAGGSQPRLRYDAAMNRATVVGIAVLVGAAWARADVRLTALFGDNMVLQRSAKTAVWGTATAGEHVTVEVAGGQGEATADASGKW